MLFIPCMYAAKSEGSRTFDLLPGTMLQPLSWGGTWITHPCLASLPTLVWTCLYAHRHTDAHTHTIGCRYCIYVENTHTHPLQASPAHTHRHELRCICSQSQREACGTAAGESCSANETFLPLDLSAGVPLNSAYIPSAHPAPLCAPLRSPALNFCQEFY